MKPLLRYGHEAMATEFEIVFADAAMDPTVASGVAAMVFSEIDRLEEELSRFKPSSDIWRINGLKAGESAYVDFATLDCLMLAKSVHAETGGAFDVTIGPLMQCWRNKDSSPRTPSEEEITSVLTRVGMDHLEIIDSEMRVAVDVDFPTIDLGALGKGYALDQAVRLLEENEVSGALLNAGASTLLAYGEPPAKEGWPIHIAVAEPRMILLREGALSCSGFDVKGNHIMNPRNGQPIPVADHRTYVKAPTAALSDALSTAFMLMDTAAVELLCERYPGVEWLR